ncbi:MAG: hypothetical protein J6C33_02055 [Lachnospiraceae bacterium]|nr:hypothetical protein [Lachnospiraceae bacterium]
MLLSGDYSWQQIALGWGVLIAAACIYVAISNKVGRKKAKTGEDRETIWNILQKAVPNIEQYTRAYATWEWSTYQGRKKITDYWYYAIAFNDQEICIVPLSFAGGDASYSQPFRIAKDQVGIVNSKPEVNWVELYDKNRQEMISMMVSKENLKFGKFEPVNIMQEEEADAFMSWKNKWMNDINAANGITVTGKMKKPVKK